MNSLADMFGDQTRQAKQAGIRKLMNCQMRPETLVWVHILEVIALLNDIEIIEVLINEETQVDMVFEIFSDSSDIFKLNYSMNKLSYNLSELMKDL